MKKYETLYATLDVDEKQAIDEVFEIVLTACKSDNGAVVLMSDLDGDGSASCLFLGNRLLLEPLLRAGGAVADLTFPPSRTVLQ